jgi:hypothetical protein
MNSIVLNGKLQKLESEKIRVYAQKSRLEMPFKNFISGQKPKGGGSKLEGSIKDVNVEKSQNVCL